MYSVILAQNKECTMSRFNKLSHAIWHCKYHVVFVPKYRYKVLSGSVGTTIYKKIRILAEQKGCEVLELNVQQDHVHLVFMVPPKFSISEVIGMLKGKTAMDIFKSYPKLRINTYWSNHFWAPGYCLDTVGIDEVMIRKYVKYQSKKEDEEQLKFNF